MLQFTNSTNAAVVRDNEIRINNQVIGMLSDEEASKILTLIQQMVGNGKGFASYGASTNTVAQKKWDDTIVGKKLYDDGVCVVTDNSDGSAKDYRLYITSKIKAVRAGIKMCATKEFDAKFAGDFDKGILFWAFPTKAKAQAFIKNQKDRNSK